MKASDLLVDFMSKTLSVSRDYLAKEHYDLLKEGEGNGDGTFMIEVDGDVVMVDFHPTEWDYPWIVQLAGWMPAALASAGWSDLASLVQLGLDAGCDELELCADVPRFPNEELLALTARED